MKRIDIEKSIVGCLVTVNNAIHLCSFLVPEHFSDIKNRRIFEAVRAITDEGSYVDMVSVASRVKDKGITAFEIASLDVGAINQSNLENTARLLVQYYNNDVITDLGNYIVQHKDKDVFERVSKVEECLGSLKFGLSSKGVIDSNKACKDFLDDYNSEKQAYYTGIEGLDRFTDGFRSGDLIIMAARPAMGKTTFTLNILLNMAYKNMNVLMFNLEMTSNQVVKRLITIDTGISGKKIREKKLSSEEVNLMGDSLNNNLNQIPFFIDDTSGSTVEDIRSKATIHKARFGLDCLIIDYLQLINKSNERMSTYDHIGNVTRSLKVLAKDLGIPIILLSQLSRAVEQRPDKKPIMSDLRESGNIEQDADSIFFLWRPEYYKFETVLIQDEEVPTPKGYLELQCRKFRDGETGDIHLKFNHLTQKIETLTEENEQQPF